MDRHPHSWWGSRPPYAPTTVPDCGFASGGTGFRGRTPMQFRRPVMTVLFTVQTVQAPVLQTLMERQAEAPRRRSEN